MSKKETLVSVGLIVNSFGKYGEVKVQILSDFPERFKDLSQVFLSRSGTDREHSARVLSVKYHKNHVILKLDISSNIEEARAYKGFFICINDSELYPLPESSFYLFDLIGLKVYLKEGNYLGILKDIYKFPAHDIFLIVDGEKEVLVPALKKFVSEICLEKKHIIISSREGMYDIDEY